ncbi:MAG: hypothetical protein ABFE08_24380 [Armatimonadia bacterium]
MLVLLVVVGIAWGEEPLRGLGGITSCGTQISLSGEAEKSSGVDEAFLKDTLSAALLRSKTVWATNIRESPRLATVYLNLNILPLPNDNLFVYTLEMELLQNVVLWNRTTCFASTWREVAYGTSDSLHFRDLARSIILQQVDRFTVAWNEENPQKK